MSKSTMRITVAPHPNKEELVAEWWSGDEEWAEVLPGPACKSFELVIFAPLSSRYVFQLDEAIGMPGQAKERLIKLGYSQGMQSGERGHSVQFAKKEGRCPRFPVKCGGTD